MQAFSKHYSKRSGEFVTFFLLLFLPIIASAEQADSLYLDFSEALAMALENNIDVQEAKYEWLAKSENASGAYGDFEPHLVGRAFKERGESPSALFTETKDEYKIGIRGKLPTGTEYDVGFSQAAYTHSDYTSELYFGGELRQHILKDGLPYFSPTSEIRTARLEREYAYQRYRDALGELFENFCDIYWNYFYAQKTLEYSTESARVADEIRNDAAKRHTLGMLSELDYKKTEAEYSDREAARLDALDKLRGARLSLLLEIGSDSLATSTRPVSIHPDTNLDSANVPMVNLDSIVENHPAFLSQKAELDIRENELKLHKTKFLPTLDLVGNYGIRSRDDDAKKAISGFKSKNRRKTVIAGGVEIDIPLFANVSERHQVAAEKARVNSARAKLAITKNKLVEEYSILQRRSLELRGQWKLSVTSVKYHEKELTEEFKKLELGKSNYHIIFDVEEDLREAKQRHLECMRALRVIDVRLARAAGRLPK